MRLGSVGGVEAVWFGDVGNVHDDHHRGAANQNRATSAQPARVDRTGDDTRKVGVVVVGLSR
jgi:hypothetical protein